MALGTGQGFAHGVQQATNLGFNLLALKQRQQQMDFYKRVMQAKFAFKDGQEGIDRLSGTPSSPQGTLNAVPQAQAGALANPAPLGDYPVMEGGASGLLMG